jgi:hypothetical protein
MTPSNVFLTCPLYDGRLDAGTARSLWSTASQRHRVNVLALGNSLLATNCNWLWCTGLNNRATGNFKWFAMLHADIEPDYWWLDTLIAEAEKHDADVMSAIVPIKDQRGVTSTAISKPGSRYQQFCRLTMRQVRHESFPDTFGIEEAASALEGLPEPLRIANVPREALLVNTGCFVCRFDRPWCEQVWFAMDEGIQRIEGQWAPVQQSEDWIFARKVAQQGGKVMATRLLPLAHKGLTQFLSTQTWGHPKDEGCQL